MEHPFFSLAKRKDLKIRHYEHNGNSVTITPSVNGMATIWDKDVLLYAASALSDALNRGGTVSRTIRIHAHDLLRYPGRGTGKRSYDNLQAAFERLTGTRIKTDITTGGTRKREGVGLIVDVRERDHESRLTSHELSRNLVQPAFKAAGQAEILTIHRQHFAVYHAVVKPIGQHDFDRVHAARRRALNDFPPLEASTRATGKKSSCSTIAPSAVFC